MLFGDRHGVQHTLHDVEVWNTIPAEQLPLAEVLVTVQHTYYNYNSSVAA